ncbi:hypothetical protein IT409_01355 [Candidatus Falkowbacteria bacterium]|nr:hypothetical protein [Candidatus Falkowbacteria bacterium]
MNKLFLILITLTMLTACSCSSDIRPLNSTTINDCKIEEFSGYAYRFRCKSDEFIVSLYAFLSDHPELEMISVVDDDRAAYGDTVISFIVFFRQKTLKVVSPNNQKEFRIFLSNELCATLPINTTKPVNLLDLCSSK